MPSLFSLFKKPEWFKVTIYLGSMTWQELMVLSWNIVDEFWSNNRQPSLYYARYTSPGTDSRIEMQVKWPGDAKELEALFSGPGINRCVVAGHNEGSEAHAAAYLLARQLKGKGETLTKDTLHWMLNMTGYSYVQEVKLLSEQVATMAANLERSSYPTT